MTVGELSTANLRSALIGEGLRVQVGPCIVRFRSPLPSVHAYMESHYAEFPIPAGDGRHFTIAVRGTTWLRNLLRPQATIGFDGEFPFTPMPARSAPGLLEWGVNYCIGRLAHPWLILHSAVVERDGRALLLPAPSGSGKSTLCAALAFSGWRLLSDEFAIVHPDTGDLLPIPRPIALKRRSVDILLERVPSIRLGPALEDNEGTPVRYAAPPAEAVRRLAERARATWVVVPKWQADANTELEPASRARTVAHLADSSFNLNARGRAGFVQLSDLVDSADCYNFTYSNLDEAIAVFDRLADSAPSSRTGAAR